MTKLIPLALMIGVTTLTLASCGEVKKSEISHQQVVKDITYLASDELKGRANFSPEITKAANYIGERFKAAGLVPLEGQAAFEQAFSLYNIRVKDSNLSLNGQVVSSDNIAIATAQESLEWSDINALKVVTIGEADDFRELVGEINSIGGNTLVIAHASHKKTFVRYQNYFSRGLNKFAVNEGDSIVIALSDVTAVDTIKLVATTHIKQQHLANVVGVLPGSSDEVILFSAHYDHLGVDDKDADDKIYNGADDDASGTTAIMNLAKYYSDQGDNQRTLIFSAFTAEEIGGYGSKYFSNHIDAKNIAAMVNIEMIGKPSKFGAGTFWMTGFDRSNLGELMNESLAPIEQQVYPDPYPKQRLFYRSDNATLARLGVPAHSFSSTQLDKDEHYHQHSDDLASLDLESMTQVINAIAVGSQGLVDGDVTPTRVDTSKVSAKGKIY